MMNRGSVQISLFLLLLMLGACDLGGHGRTNGPEERIDSSQVDQLLRSVTEHEFRRQSPTEKQGASWQLCAFYSGVMAAHDATGFPSYRERVRRWAETNEWSIREDRARHADFQCIGQIFLELYRQDRRPHMIEETKSVFDEIMQTPRSGREMWSWADALFMAPPVLARLGSVTGQQRYFDFLSRQYWDASAPLYDPEYGLYYRDTRYRDRQTVNGHPVCWARGNGWVLAGLARILEALPEDYSGRRRFERRFRAMAKAVASLQGEEGFWPPSLLDPGAAGTRETSGTGFFCYALAWGVNHGHLSRERYEPVVRTAWGALRRSVNEDGRLGWVQPPGSRPAPAVRTDTYPYGAGALLLAGSEVLDMLDESSS